jgi:hypothetical protein
MRASVYMHGFDGLALSDEEKRVLVWQIKPVWENNGTTGTRHMYNHVSWKTFPGEIPDDFDFPDIWDEGEKQERAIILIGPQSKLNGRTVSIPTEELIDAGQGRKRVFIWGWAEYDEVFPNTPRHRIEFCVELKVLGDATVANFNHFVPSFEIRHNGADEECGQRYLDAQKRRPRFATT